MSPRAPEKLYKIGEVCRIADVQPYVLRYWETEFPPLAPSKSGGGQRAYSQQEIDLVLRIKQLLYSEGFTIAGAKKKLEAELAEGTAGENAAASSSAADTAVSGKPLLDRDAVADLKRELRQILALLD